MFKTRLKRIPANIEEGGMVALRHWSPSIAWDTFPVISYRRRSPAQASNRGFFTVWGAEYFLPDPVEFTSRGPGRGGGKLNSTFEKEKY